MEKLSISGKAVGEGAGRILGNADKSQKFPALPSSSQQFPEIPSFSTGGRHVREPGSTVCVCGSKRNYVRFANSVTAFHFFVFFAVKNYFANFADFA